jgi:multimeric flavodoxin WrbA
MKVVAINGSPHKEGNTYHALKMVGSKLEENGIDMEIIHIGDKSIRGCIACGKCGKNQDEKCSITTDPLNEWIQKMKYADGIILASPVYYSGIPGTMKCFLDRAFYVSGSNGGLFRHKTGAALVAVRRTGGSSALDSLNHYLTYSEMIIATSNYWNIIHGRLPGEVEEDHEGRQIMEVVGSNLSWLLKMRQQTTDTLQEPDQVKKISTSFIR